MWIFSNISRLRVRKQLAAGEETRRHCFERNHSNLKRCVVANPWNYRGETIGHFDRSGDSINKQRRRARTEWSSKGKHTHTQTHTYILSRARGRKSIVTDSNEGYHRSVVRPINHSTRSVDRTTRRVRNVVPPILVVHWDDSNERERERERETSIRRRVPISSRFQPIRRPYQSSNTTGAQRHRGNRHPEGG